MRFLFLLLLFSSSFLSAQILDDFTDSEFNNNPVWIGDTADWTIENEQLRSNSNTASHGFYLSTASNIANNAQWELYVNLKFQTSSANYTDIYLISEEADLKSITNSGYFVRIGNTSDEISLYKCISGSDTEIIDGLDATVNSSNNSIYIKVMRNGDSLWTLQSNLVGPGYGYITEGTVVDSSITSSNYFGIFVQQSTSTFHLNHFYDDIYVGLIVMDSLPPSIESTTVMSGTEVDVVFNEFIDLTSSEIATNYTVDNGLGNPITAKRDENNFSLVHLTFSNPFADGISNTLRISNVQDLNGNNAPFSTSTFTFIVPATALFKDIIINEIFADPSPQIGLPNAEFIEIYNNSEKDLDLSGWKLTDGATTGTLTNYMLAAHHYLIVCSKTDTTVFKPFGDVLGISSFPILNNSGDQIHLKNNTLVTIDSANYSDNWYGDETKKAGGWSLELTNQNANTNCPVSNYWTAPNNYIGGTPGIINSTYSSIPDNEAPQLIRVNILGNDTLQIYFNESLDIATASNTSTYTIDNGIGTPLQVQAMDADTKNLQLILETTLQAGIIYTLNIGNTLSDCSGIAILPNTTTQFVIPESAITNDIVINEILFDPKTNGIDFVEIYNRSDKMIDLKTIIVSQYDTIHNVLINISNITTESRLMHPGEYILLSENGTIVKNQYHTSHPEGFIDVDDLPTMNIASGTICLATNANHIIDLLIYNENMQFPLLNSSKGVSLERIDFDRKTQDRGNWHSAAEAVGFATPAYKNSQYNDAGETKDAIEIIHPVFSPDEDGMNDIVNVNYHFDSPGLIANINIYDSKGRAVKQLVRNELLGIKGTFSWDGINENREKAKIGIYIVFVEVFDLSGKVRHYKKTCVLAGKL